MAWLMRGKVKSEKTKNNTQTKNDFEFVGLLQALVNKNGGNEKTPV